MDNPPIDLRDTLRNPATLVYGHEALHMHMAGALAMRARLDAERTGAAPVPAPGSPPNRGPDRMLALVMSEVERLASDLLPVAQRPPSPPWSGT
jgi:hypothetical protein